MTGPSASILQAELPPRTATAPSKPTKTKKKLIRRSDRDYSQLLRRSYQAAFLLLNVWLGGVFHSWVRGLETGTASREVAPPPGIEGWLPIAGLMNLKYFLLTGWVPTIHPAAMFLLITFLAISFLFRKAFCSWLCPVGTVSEYLGLLGQKLFGRNFRIWRWIDIPLRGLKYFLLGFFVWAISSMSAAAIANFMRSDYGLVAGVAVLFFGIVGYAKAVGLWDSHVPAAVYRQLVPNANTARHPMPGDPEISR